MGNSNSNLSKHLGAVSNDERFFGLDNFGNTCYCNSVLQALYACARFRDQLLRYDEEVPDAKHDDGLLFALAGLFREERVKHVNASHNVEVFLAANHTRLAYATSTQIAEHSKQHGNMAPSRFISTVRRADQRFRSYAHQDAQEFLNFTLDTLVSTIQKIQAQETPEDQRNGSRDAMQAMAQPATPAPRTWVHEIFCGKTITHTRCMNCEGKSERQEQFLELTLEVQGVDTTLEQCMLSFSKKELLDADNKFHCENCNSYQEAQKWVDLRECPPVLVIHLNRLSFQHHLGREHKLKHRVIFRPEFTPPNMMEGVHAPLYKLFGVVAHVGNTAAHGHYISYVKRCGMWFLFDDDKVNFSNIEEVESTFGRAASDWPFGNNDTHAYMLFYEMAGDDNAAISNNTILDITEDRVELVS